MNAQDEYVGWLSADDQIATLAALSGHARRDAALVIAEMIKAGYEIVSSMRPHAVAAPSELATADRRVADMREAAARWHETERDEHARHARDPKLPLQLQSYHAAKVVAHADSAAAIRALPLPDAPEPQGWRDIATAPRDGTEVLVWTGSEWLIASWRIGTPPYPFEGWTTGWETAGGYDVGYAPISPPTHWQPLPEPPSSRTAQDDGATP